MVKKKKERLRQILRSKWYKQSEVDRTDETTTRALGGVVHNVNNNRLSLAEV